MKIVKQSVEVIAHTPDPEKVIERAGRVCYKSECRISEDSHVRFVKMLMVRDHLSVLEHASATLHIVTDRAIANEMVRHRAGFSYSQKSTRYCKEGELEVIMPAGLNELTQCEWAEGMRHAEAAYKRMLDFVKPEIARAALPLCLATEIVVTGNFRAWRHFLKLRLAPSAHPEMRHLACLILVALKPISPTVFVDLDKQNP